MKRMIASCLRSLCFSIAIFLFSLSPLQPQDDVPFDNAPFCDIPRTDNLPVTKAALPLSDLPCVSIYLGGEVGVCWKDENHSYVDFGVDITDGDGSHWIIDYKPPLVLNISWWGYKDSTNRVRFGFNEVPVGLPNADEFGVKYCPSNRTCSDLSYQGIALFSADKCQGDYWEADAPYYEEIPNNFIPTSLYIGGDRSVILWSQGSKDHLCASRSLWDFDQDYMHPNPGVPLQNNVVGVHIYQDRTCGGSDLNQNGILDSFENSDPPTWTPTPTRTSTPVPNPNDNTPPSASGFSVSASGRTAYISTSGVQDNPGGSGVKEVRFSAKFNNEWKGIGEATSSPYSLSWDMCSSGVPDGDIELGMEVWDYSNNKWVWSEHYSNPHITKSYDCAPPPQCVTPGTPNLIWPSSGTEIETGSHRFTWGSASQATYYNFELATDNNFSNIINSFYTSNLFGDTISLDTGTYYWRVRARNQIDGQCVIDGAYSTINWVKVKASCEKPDTPYLTWPSDGSEIEPGSHRFRWNITSPATLYNFQLATDNNFSNIINSYHTSNLYVDTISLDTGTYYWRVRARNQIGDQCKVYGDFSATYSVQVSNHPTATPTRTRTPNSSPIQTPIPTRTPTRVPTSTPTKTSTPTAMPTLTPTKTPTPTRTLTPRSLFLPFVSHDLFPPSTLQFDDDFCGKRIWTILDTSNYSMSYVASSPCQYQIAVKTSYGVWVTPGTFAENFMVEGRLQSIGSDGGSGLLFGLSSDNQRFYAMIITATGNYALFRYDSEWETIIPWTYSLLIRKDSPNVLTLISTKEQLSLFLNSVLVETVTESHSHAGRLGLYTYTNTGNFSARYSRFTVWNADLKSRTRGQENPDSGGVSYK